MKHCAAWVLPLLVLVIASCSTSQFTLYKPIEDEASWRVSVVKKAIANKFVCTINDSVVVEESFGFFSSTFEKDGHFQGKSVKMSGFKKISTVHGSNGATDTEESYQIRVFIDGKEVSKFDF